MVIARDELKGECDLWHTTAQLFIQTLLSSCTLGAAEKPCILDDEAFVEHQTKTLFWDPFLQEADAMEQQAPAPPSQPYGHGPQVSRSAPFSVHSRGVQLFDGYRILDCQYVGLTIFRSLRDISGSLWTFSLCQGWLSVWVTLVTIVSVLFFNYINGGRVQALDWTVVAFMVLLPLVSTLWWAYQRRERALSELAQGTSGGRLSHDTQCIF